jgi:uncharacterized protein YbbC (DUF1343 family)
MSGTVTGFINSEDMFKLYMLILPVLIMLSCSAKSKKEEITHADRKKCEQADTVSLHNAESLQCGAARFEAYVPEIRGKKVGLVANHTSRVKNVHLVDTLLAQGVDVRKIFAPEHGFRGTADAGEHINDGNDERTGLPLISLYGSNRKPTGNNLSGLDVVLFDIQDVGVRFYTYISTMHYVMEACAENNIPVIVLDRPNPNIDLCDGPVLDTAYSSFVGMHPVPVAHGMTVAEYARMINGEGWLKNGITCDLSWVSCENYTRDMAYKLPVPPSPNLPNQRSIRLYPTLCFFEATSLSVGRGTDMQFQIVGHPALRGKTEFSFTPESNAGSAHPKFKNKTCYGYDFRKDSERFDFEPGQLQLNWLMDIYTSFPSSATFFDRPGFFDKLAGGKTLRTQMENGVAADIMRQGWKNDLNAFKEMREPYLLYE